ncbi:MAG: tyrosine-type recombinase/integrase [Lachnospiraceae bacterium]|nr:tyrosine-type recombinase/integrase [Lachnospiraceae bacterium]
MSRRKPNGYGSITRMKGNRSRPWVIRVTVYDEDGFGRQVPIAYAETEEKANILLAQYNNNPWNIDREKVTLAALYRRWEESKLPRLGKANQYSLRASYKHCYKYYGMKYRAIRAYHMQEAIDNCGLGVSTQINIKNLWEHLDQFAYELDIIDKMYSPLTTTQTPPETTREPFTPEQIQALWKIADREWVDTVLIFLYSGFRRTELLTMKIDQVDLDEKLFRAGIKTANGKNRIVPIHSKIFEFVQTRVEHSQSGYLFECEGRKLSLSGYYKLWNQVMEQIGAAKTPHEARHTFETELDNAKGNRKCIDLLMGHKSKDIGNRVYNHKTIEQLRETVELLK